MNANVPSVDKPQFPVYISTCRLMSFVPFVFNLSFSSFILTFFAALSEIQLSHVSPKESTHYF
jgi:hypothetical protein